MRTAAIIPARYHSTRFKGKPLADICGRPMVWWVYQQVKKCMAIDEVLVATDNEEIMETCRLYDINCMMTSKNHRTSTERLYEVSRKILADIYVCVNGDEPLIEPEIIEQIVPKDEETFFAANLMSVIQKPSEVVDETNIKVVTDTDGFAPFFSRSPIPHPKSSIRFEYYKHLGVLAYSRQALEFFATTPKGEIEKIEDINELRFVEHGKKLKMIPVRASSLSVDTPKDLDYVRAVIKERLQKGEWKF